MSQKSLMTTRLDKKKRAIFTNEKFKKYYGYKRTTDTVDHNSLTYKPVASAVTSIETGMDDTVRATKKLKPDSIYSESFLDFVKTEIEDNESGIGSKPHLFEEDFSGPNIWSTSTSSGKLASELKELKED